MPIWKNELANYDDEKESNVGNKQNLLMQDNVKMEIVYILEL